MSRLPSAPVESVSQGKSTAPISVVIPTLGRERVLLETIEQLKDELVSPAELIVVDQTPRHEEATAARLQHWNRQRTIRLIRRGVASIPAAMNHGLRLAAQPVVLFLDDDIKIVPGLLRAHAAEHEAKPAVKAVVGQVLQPGEKPVAVRFTGQRHGLQADLRFPFFSSEPDSVANVMAGNLSVRRDFALAIGGFDENFEGAAYRFETEFARRVIANGGEIRFCPEASIHHLRAERGGTRQTGSHLTSADPRHGVGDYYFAFLHGGKWESWRYSLLRPFREVRTRFHLTHPWWIPVKLLGEIRAFVKGFRMAARKRRENSLKMQASNDTSELSGNVNDEWMRADG